MTATTSSSAAELGFINRAELSNRKEVRRYNRNGLFCPKLGVLFSIAINGICFICAVEFIEQRVGEYILGEQQPLAKFMHYL